MTIKVCQLPDNDGLVNSPHSAIDLNLCFHSFFKRMDSRL